MKLYTRSGDKGITSLKGGKRVPKDHPRIEACGTIDELVSWIGLLKDQNIDEKTKELLHKIQDKLMVSASLLAAEKETNTKSVRQINDEDVRQIEAAIDAFDSNLPRLTSIIIPGGHPIVSSCHIARNVCRRAERKMVKLIKGSDNAGTILKYLNRLSDFLFALSRKLLYDFGGKEIYWEP